MGPAARASELVGALMDVQREGGGGRAIAISPHDEGAPTQRSAESRRRRERLLLQERNRPDCLAALSTFSGLTL